MRLSPVLTGLRTYPFVRLAEAKRRLVDAGVDVIDFGPGEPREDTPEFIREALVRSLDPQSRYPAAEGLPELRAAIATWTARRFGVPLDPATEVVPTFGSKEAVFLLAQVLDGDLVLVPQPSYPVYERGAVFAGKHVVELPLHAERGFLPDLDAVPADVLKRTSILWLNYPNNPTAATATVELYERAAALAREYDFVLASDEAYSELYRWPTGPTSRSSTRSPSARRCPATVPGSWPATPTSWPRSSATDRTSASRRRSSSSSPPRPRGATRRTSKPSATSTAPSATC
jgi:acetylornithine aminotransferase